MRPHGRAIDSSGRKKFYECRIPNLEQDKGGGDVIFSSSGWITNHRRNRKETKREEPDVSDTSNRLLTTGTNRLSSYPSAIPLPRFFPARWRLEKRKVLSRVQHDDTQRAIYERELPLRVMVNHVMIERETN